MQTKRDRGPVNLYLDKDLVRRLQLLAEEIGTSASAIVEELVADKLKRATGIAACS